MVNLEINHRGDIYLDSDHLLHNWNGRFTALVKYLFELDELFWNTFGVELVLEIIFFNIPR